MLYQNQQRNGRHKSTCRLWSNRLLHERKLHTTDEAGKTTPTKTTKNMEYQQYAESSQGNHVLYYPRSTNQGSQKDDTVPGYKHRKRGYHTRISMDGRIRTSIYMEEWRHSRKRGTYHPPVCKPFYSQRPDNRTNKGRKQPNNGYNLNRTRNQSTAVHKKGGSPKRIPTVRQNIQRTRIKTIPTKTSVGSRDQVQTGRPRRSRL